MRPLYSTPSPTVTGSVNDNIRSKLASISINQPGDRVTQEVRNNLIFLFAGGAGEPASPVYSLQLERLVEGSVVAARAECHQ